MARIGLDIDSVIFPFPQLFRQYAIDNEWLVADAPYPTTWSFYEEWGWDRDQFLLVHDEFVNDFGYQSGPLIGERETLQALKRLSDAGNDVVLVTARHTVPSQRDAIEAQTREWLHVRRVPFDELRFERDKTRVPVDYFLDDRYSNYSALAESGVESWLLDQPWNRAERRGGELVVSSVAEYVDYVLKGEQVDRESSEVRVKNETTGGEKGQKLARFDLVPADAMIQVAEHYGKGARKYADNNWRLGYNWSLSLGALERHLNEFKAGRDFDPETGSNHMAAVVFHALSLLTFYKEHPELDDRFSTTHKVVSDV